MLASPIAMHIPDGFLSTTVSIIFWIISIIIISYALKRVNQELGERQLPLMGVLAAAIFAGQMLNFTIAGGTSGHLLGAAIATILIGPFPAILVMTSVVSIQALIFQDGGLLALGSNLFNMAVVGVVVSYMVYRTIYRLSGGKSWGIFVGGFAAAWLSIEVAALSCALQLALSGTSPANISVPAMGGIHALIGIGEGLITVGALAFIYSARRDIITHAESSASQGKLVWVVGLSIAIGLAVLSPLASTNPDGLESVADQLGFLAKARPPSFIIIPDYIFPGISNQALATIIAGLFGILLVFGVVFGVSYWKQHRHRA